MTTSTPITKQNYIDGRWVDSESGEFVEGINPATEEVISRTPVSLTADVDRAVQAASAAFESGPWPAMTHRERGEAISRLAAVVTKRLDELGAWATAESGGVRLPFAGIRGAAALLEDAAARAATYPWVESFSSVDSPVSSILGLPLSGGALLRQPIGVVGAITPFNAPSLITPWTLGPALIAGNTMVLKPSPHTPLQAVFYAEAAEEAGIPPGVFNMITDGPGVGEAMSRHPDIGMIWFVGSDVVGRKVMEQASATLKRLVMELGGKSANIVFADADLPRALPNLLQFLILAGQGCSLTTRILAERSIHEKVVEAICAALREVKLGNPAMPGIGMGPLIRESARSRVEGYVARAISDGCELVVGGKRPDGLDKGFFYEPTVFANVDNSLEIAQDEIFGPVLVIVPFDDEEHAVHIANDSRYGLGGGVHTSDVHLALRVATAVRTGRMAINGGGAVPQMPTGGVKQSGFGRVHGDFAFDEVVQLKAINWPARA